MTTPGARPDLVQTGELVALVNRVLQVPAVAAIDVLADALEQLRSSVQASTYTREDAERFVAELSKLLFEHRMQRELADLSLPFPAYNYLQDFSANERLPWAPPLAVRPVVADRKWRLLGHDIGLPIGIPASPLTVNSEWIAYNAQNGFNVLTYKTVRTKARPSLPHPNWMFLAEPRTPIAIDSRHDTVAFGNLAIYPETLDRYSTANSFGVPSREPQWWIEDVRSALSRIANDQLLILSIMGTFEDLAGPALVADFVEGATLGATTGVSVLELNLSCPNGIVNGKVLPPICSDPEAVRTIVEAVRAAIPPTIALVIKVGYLSSDELVQVLSPVAGMIDAISGINTWQAPVYDAATRSTPAFGDRLHAAISGHSLQLLALDFVERVAKLRSELGVEFDIIGMGGVMTAPDALRLYDAGASAVQTATGAFFKPELARDIATEYGKEFPRHTSSDLVNLALATSEVKAELERLTATTVMQLAASCSFGPSVVTHVLNELVKDGQAVQLTADRGIANLYASR